MQFRPDTPDGLFHDGNPLTGEKGLPAIPAAFLNELLSSVRGSSARSIDADAEMQSQEDVVFVEGSDPIIYTMLAPTGQGVVTLKNMLGCRLSIVPPAGITINGNPEGLVSITPADIIRLFPYSETDWQTI